MSDEIKNIQPKEILKCDWKLFLKYKKWHKTMRAWNISITKSLLKECENVWKE